MIDYTPNDWFWIVAGDTSRAWSSAVSAYVDEWPADRLTQIASEQELNDVLAPYGLRGPLVLAAHIKAECQRRIIALWGASDLQSCIVKQVNATARAAELTDMRVSGDTLTHAEEVEAAQLRAMFAAVKHLRARSNALEATLPADYTSDALWE